MDDNGRQRYTYDGGQPRYDGGAGPSRYSYDAGPGQVKVKGPSPKLVIGIVTAVVLAIAAVVGVFLLWLNSKTPVTVEEFTAVAEDHGFTVRAMERDELESPGYYQAAVAGFDSRDGCEIDFCQMRNMGAARWLFDQMGAEIDAMARGKEARYVDINMMRYESYAVTTSEMYYYVAYIEDTVVIASGSKGCKDEIRSIVKELGY